MPWGNDPFSRFVAQRQAQAQPVAGPVWAPQNGSLATIQAGRLGANVNLPPPPGNAGPTAPSTNPIVQAAVSAAYADNQASPGSSPAPAQTPPGLLLSVLVDQAQRRTAQQQANRIATGQNAAMSISPPIKSGVVDQGSIDPYSQAQKDAFASGTWKPVLDSRVTSAYGGVNQGGPTIAQQQAQIAGLGGKSGGEDIVGGAVNTGANAVSGPFGTLADAKDWAIKNGFPLIDWQRKLTTTQMGQLVYDIANGNDSAAMQLLGDDPTGAGGRVLQTLKDQILPDKDLINSYYTTGGEMGGADVFDPATGRMVHQGGEHIDGGRAVYEKYVAAGSDKWPIYLRAPFRLLFDIVADPVTYELPLATKVGEGAVETGRALRAGESLGQMGGEGFVRDVAPTIVKDTAAPVVTDATAPLVSDVAAPAAADATKAGAANVASDSGPLASNGFSEDVLKARRRAGIPDSNTTTPISATGGLNKTTAVGVAKETGALAGKIITPTDVYNALTPAEKAQATFAAREIKVTVGYVLEGTGQVLRAPQEILDAAAKIVVGGPIKLAKIILGDLSDPSQRTLNNWIGKEAELSGREVSQAPSQIEGNRFPDPTARDARSPYNGRVIDEGPMTQAQKDWRVEQNRAMDVGTTSNLEPIGNANPPKRWTAADVMSEGPGWDYKDAAIEANRRNSVGPRGAYDAANTYTGPIDAPSAETLAPEAAPRQIADLGAESVPGVSPQPVGDVPLDAHATPQAVSDIAATPDWYRERTPAERSAAIQEGAINETTPIPVGERVVDNVYRDWALAGSPASQEKWRQFLQDYQPAARDYNREQAAIQGNFYTDFEQKKATQAVLEAEHVVNDVVPAYAKASGGDLPEIAITRPRAEAPGGGRVSFAKESTEYLVQRAVYSTDDTAAQDAMNFLARDRWASAPWKNDMLTRLQTVRDQVKAIQEADRGPVQAYEREKQTVYQIHDNGDRIKVSGHPSTKQAQAEADRLNGTLTAQPNGVSEPVAQAAPTTIDAGPQVTGAPPVEPVPATAPTAPTPPTSITPPASPSRAERIFGALPDLPTPALPTGAISTEAARDPSILGEMVQRGEIGQDSYDLMKKRVYVQGQGSTSYYDVFDGMMVRHGPNDMEGAINEFAHFVQRVEGTPIKSTAVGKVWRAAMAIPKGITQFNSFTGMRGVANDTVGDSLRMIGEGHGAAVIDGTGPISYIKSHIGKPDALDGFLEQTGLAAPNLEPSLQRTGELASNRTPLVDAIMKIPGAKSIPRGETIAHILTAPVDNKWIRELRSGMDTLRRRAVFLDTMQKEYGARQARWLELSSARMEKAGLDPASFDHLPDLFSPQQAREAAISAGASPDLANRVARDWRAELNSMAKAGNAEQKRVLFSFETTRADEALSNVLYFHYWMTRAYPAYASMAIRNPEFLALWYRVWQTSERQAAQEGQPAGVTGRLRFMGSLGGFYASMDPWNVLAPFSPTQGSATNGTFYDTKISQFVYFNPAIEMAAAVLGLSRNAPDPLGSYSIRKYMGTVANYGRAKGWWGEQSLGDAPYQQIIINAVNASRDLISHVIPITSKRLADDPNAYNMDLMAYVARTVVEEQTGVPFDQWKPDGPEYELWNAANVAIKTQSGDNAIANEAFSRYMDAKASNDLASLGLPGSTRLRYGPRDQVMAAKDAGYKAIKEGDQPTTNEQTAMDFTNSAQATGGAAPIIAQDQQYGALGTKWSQGLNTGWTIISFDDALTMKKEFAKTTGKLSNYIKIGGRWLSIDALAALPEDQRKRLADQWVSERTDPTANNATGTGELQTLRDQETAFKTANPEYATFADWKTQARNYPGGLDAWIAQERKGNPNFDQYLQGKSNVQVAALSIAGYNAYRGQIDNVYGAPTKSINDPSAIPYNAAGSATTGSGTGTVKLSRPDSLRKSIDTYNQAWAGAAQYLPNGGRNWTDLVPSVRSAYIDQLGKRGITVPSMPAVVATYLKWVALQPPGADTSAEAYFAWLDATKQVTVGDPSLYPVDPSLAAAPAA